MEHPLSSKNQTDPSRSSSESENLTYVEHVRVIDDGTKEYFALRRVSLETDRADVEKLGVEQVTVGNDQRGETLELRRAHPEVIAATARAGSVRGLLWIIALTIVLGFIGIVWLSIIGHSTDVVREVVQTALAAEVTILASSLAKPGN